MKHPSPIAPLRELNRAVVANILCARLRASFANDEHPLASASSYRRSQAAARCKILLSIWGASGQGFRSQLRDVADVVGRHGVVINTRADAALRREIGAIASLARHNRQRIARPKAWPQLPSLSSIIRVRKLGSAGSVQYTRFDES